MKRYNSSAKIEIRILEDLKKQGGAQNNIVLLHESFIHRERDSEHTCMVFETLGKSLYEFIKANKYYGFSLYQIQSIA